MQPEVIIYTDGAAKGNPGPGGFGLIMHHVPSGKRKEYAKGFRYTTNNRMELMAVIEGLMLLNKSNIAVLVVSDSKYVVDAVEKKWVFNWEKKQFKDKKNPDLWKQFLTLFRQHTIRFQWIKGHNLHPENERCDQLAQHAATQANQAIDHGYEQETNELF
jgi:ribonuclease HI